MNLNKILEDPLKQDKEKITFIAKLMIEDVIGKEDIMNIAKECNENNLVIFLEAIEMASKEDPNCILKEYLIFSGKYISSSYERMQWISIRIIGSLASLYPDDLEGMIEELLKNTNHQSIAIRWAIADTFAIILTLPKYQKGALYGRLMDIYHHEKQQSVRRAYYQALHLDENRKHKRKREVIYR